MITYGIIGAMPSELSEIAAAFPDALKETSAMYEFHVAEKNGKKIVFVCCGIGKVNSAVCTQVLIDRYNPDFIINTGVAGGMGKEVKVCDIVIASDARHHDLVPRLLETILRSARISNPTNILSSLRKRLAESLDMLATQDGLFRESSLYQTAR